MVIAILAAAIGGIALVSFTLAFWALAGRVRRN